MRARLVNDEVHHLISELNKVACCIDGFGLAGLGDDANDDDDDDNGTFTESSWIPCARARLLLQSMYRRSAWIPT